MAIPSKRERAQLEMIRAARLIRQTDSCLKDACLALVRAERILGADEIQNAVQAQRINAEGAGRNLASIAAILEAMVPSLHAPADR